MLTASTVLIGLGLITLGAGCFSKSKTTTTTDNVNTVKTTTVNVNATTTTTGAFNAKASDAQILAETNGQWANTATASTQYGDDAWSAEQATGGPDVDSYGDNGSAWAPKEVNKGVETLTVTFAKTVTPAGVRIRESYGSGSITKVELLDTDGVYQTIWEGADSTTGLKYLQIAVTDATYETNTIRITFDTTKAPTEWTEIDAVQLVGE